MYLYICVSFLYESNECKTRISEQVNPHFKTLHLGSISRLNKAIVDIILRPGAQSKGLQLNTDWTEYTMTCVDTFSKWLDAYVPVCENVTSSTKPEVLVRNIKGPSHGMHM